MSHIRTILVDLDGTIADLVAVWLEAYNGVSGEALTPADVTSYHWHELVRDSHLFYEQLASKPLFRMAKPFKDISGFERLCADPRFDVHVVSYVHHASEDGHAQKLAWLAEFCPYFDPSKVTFTKQKHLVFGDVLIEDSPDNIDAWTAAHPNGHAICIRAAYNKNWHPTHSRRVTMAEDITEAVRAIFRSYT